MKVQSSMSSVLPKTNLDPTVTSAVVAQDDEGRFGHDGGNSGVEQVVRGVVSRLDSLLGRLGNISVAANGVARLQARAIPEHVVGSQVSPQGFKVRQAQNHKTVLAVEALLDEVRASKGAVHVARAELSKLSSLDLVGDPEVQVLSRRFADEASALLRGVPGMPQGAQRGAKSSDDFFNQLLGLIGVIKEDYLGVYEGALERYSNLYKEFNKLVMGSLGSNILPHGEGEIYMQLFGNWGSGPGIGTALEQLLKKYGTVDDSGDPGLLFMANEGAAGREEALKWAEAMGLPESCVTQMHSGHVWGGKVWIVKMDLAPLESMLEGLKKLANNSVGSVGILSSAQFQAWQTGFNSLEGDVKNQLQLFTTKYSNANSYHENFNKILSSQLVQYAEMLKQMLSGIA